MNKKTVISALLISVMLLLCMPQELFASGNRRDILGEGTNYTSVLYDSSNGLPTSEANAIIQSSDGFIWIGSYSGLIRYDGTTFERFDASSGISSVLSLYVDSANRLWIGTNENGLAYYENGKITTLGRQAGMKSHSVKAITADSMDNIVVGTTQGIAYVSAKDDRVYVIDDPLINSEYIYSLHTDPRGIIYGLTNDGDIFRISDLQISGFFAKNTLSDYTITSIYPDPENPDILYAGTSESELLKLDASSDLRVLKCHKTSHLLNINAILPFNGLLWTAAANGIGYFDEDMHFTMLEDVPMNNIVSGIMADHESNLWFTSTRQGVMKIVPDRFIDIMTVAGLPNTTVNSTCLNDGKLYIATDTGLFILKDGSWKQVTNELTGFLADVRIRCITKDSKGGLWFSTHGYTGLVHYSASHKIRCFNEGNGMEAVRVSAAAELADGSMSVATNDGLYIITDGKVSAHYSQEDGLATPEILSVSQGPDGRIYLGTDGDGIYILNENGIESHITIDDGLTSGVVMRIKWDPERKLLWLITSDSIEYMKDGVITEVSNFPYSNNYDIYFDNRDNAWILASNGIYTTKASMLLDSGNLEYSFYNTLNGLPCIATGNSRSYLDEDGRLFIAGSTGVCLVDINSPEDANSGVILSIPSVDIDDINYPIGNQGEIVVPAGSRRLKINARAITFGLSNPHLSYQLQGFDEKAVLTTKQELSSILYTNLDGGSYKFILNIIDDETGEITGSTSILVLKESSLYEHIWFWLILTVITVAVIAALMYNSFKKKNVALLKKREHDRQYINQIMHTIAKCVDLRDRQNVGHSFRVAYYTRLLAEKLAEKRGYDSEKIDQFYHIALLHDIGKIGIPDAILNKPEKLNDEEYEIMRSHTRLGEDLLSDVDIVKDLAVGAGCHHERFDGKGYPHAYSADEIPEVAKVIAVADTFDAMYSTRPYRKQMLLSDVLAELKRISGTQVDPEVVDALFALAEENKLDKEVTDAYVAGVKAKRNKAEDKKK